MSKRLRPIFVFGSNLRGAHGGGAAVEAADRGFPWGLGSGYHSGSRCYAIPTLDEQLQRLSVDRLVLYISQFHWFNRVRTSRDACQVTRVGCGIAGFSDDIIAPMFNGAVKCHFDLAWTPWLKGARYWGTYE